MSLCGGYSFTNGFVAIFVKESNKHHMGESKVGSWQAQVKLLCPASILCKSTSVRHRPVSYPDGPMTARYRFT